ncbi:hypothetical protein [Flavobacterium sp.]|uniref:hypothetical protein n=1 Tax=Flavobacterium sp. TaxID=239 RepID=UPI003750D154
MNTTEIIRNYNFKLLENILSKKTATSSRNKYLDNVKDENFDKPLSSLNQDYTQKGYVILVTKTKVSHN